MYTPLEDVDGDESSAEDDDLEEADLAKVVPRKRAVQLTKAKPLPFLLTSRMSASPSSKSRTLSPAASPTSSTASLRRRSSSSSSTSSGTSSTASLPPIRRRRRPSRKKSQSRGTPKEQGRHLHTPKSTKASTSHGVDYWLVRGIQTALIHPLYDHSWWPLAKDLSDNFSTASPILTEHLLEQIDPASIEDVELVAAGHFGNVFTGFSSTSQQRRFIKEQPLDKQFAIEIATTLVAASRDMPSPSLIGLAPAPESAGKGPNGEPRIWTVFDISLGLPVDSFVKKAANVDFHTLFLTSAIAVYRLHKARIIHNDIAARNFLATDLSHVQIIDFGLSVVAKSAKLGARGVPYPYKPIPLCQVPAEFVEAFHSKGEPYCSFATDVHAFGLYMWETLTNEAPMQEIHAHKSSPAALSEALRTIRPKRPSSPLCTDELWALMQRCWAPDPADRPRMKTVVSELIALMPSAGPAWSEVELFLAEPNQALMKAASIGDTTLMRYFITCCHASPFFVAERSLNTPLHVAACRGQLAAVRYLVEQQYADFNAPNAELNTPLAALVALEFNECVDPVESYVRTRTEIAASQRKARALARVRMRGKTLPPVEGRGAATSPMAKPKPKPKPMDKRSYKKAVAARTRQFTAVAKYLAVTCGTSLKSKNKAGLMAREVAAKSGWSASVTSVLRPRAVSLVQPARKYAKSPRYEEDGKDDALVVTGLHVTVTPLEQHAQLAREAVVESIEARRLGKASSGSIAFFGACQDGSVRRAKYAVEKLHVNPLETNLVARLPVSYSIAADRLGTTALCLSYCSMITIADLHIGRFFEVLVRGNDGSANLSRVDLVDVPLGDDSLAALKHALEQPTEVFHELHMQRCVVEPESVGALAEALAASTTLRSLTFRESNVDAYGEALARSVGAMSGVVFLDLSMGKDKRESDSGARFFPHVPVLPSVETLVLAQHCFVGGAGGELRTFCKNLVSSGTLRELVLTGCQFEEDGVDVLMEELAAHNCVEVLDLREVNLGMRGVEAVERFLQTPECKAQEVHVERLYQEVMVSGPASGRCGVLGVVPGESRTLSEGELDSDLLSPYHLLDYALASRLATTVSSTPLTVELCEAWVLVLVGLVEKEALGRVKGTVGVSERTYRPHVLEALARVLTQKKGLVKKAFPPVKKGQEPEPGMRHLGALVSLYMESAEQAEQVLPKRAIGKHNARVLMFDAGVDGALTFEDDMLRLYAQALSRCAWVEKVQGNRRHRCLSRLVQICDELGVVPASAAVREALDGVRVGVE